MARLTLKWGAKIIQNEGFVNINLKVFVPENLSYFCGMKNVAVIGGGTMGNGIAHVFAQSGYSVTLIDIKQEMLEKAIATITKNMDRMIAKEKITVNKKIRL